MSIDHFCAFYDRQPADIDGPLLDNLRLSFSNFGQVEFALNGAQVSYDVHAVYENSIYEAPTEEMKKWERRATGMIRHPAWSLAFVYHVDERAGGADFATEMFDAGPDNVVGNDTEFVAWVLTLDIKNEVMRANLTELLADLQHAAEAN